MSRVFKIFGIVVATLLLLGVIGSVLFVKLVNPNNFKSQLITAINKNTGRQVAINGDISWSLVPHLGLHIKQIVVGNAPEFEQQPFAQIGDLDVSIRILALLKGQIDFYRIALDNVNLNLITKAQGQNNWQDLMKNTQNNPATIANNTISSNNLGKNFNFAISSIAINNAALTWNNQKTKQITTIKNLRLNSHNIEFNKPFPAQLQFDLSSNQHAIQLKIAADSSVQLSPEQHHYALEKLNIEGKLLDQSYRNGQLPFNLHADLSVNQKQEIIIIDDLSAGIANFNGSGKLTIEGFQQQPIIQGQFSIPAFNPRDLLTALGKNVHFANANVMQSAEGAFSLQWANNNLTIDNLQAKLDDMHLQGGIHLTQTKTTVINSDLNIDQLYPDRYKLSNNNSTNASSNSTTQSPIENSQQSSANTPLFAIPKGWQIAGSLRVGQFRVQNITLTNLNMQYSIQQELCKFAPITADLYQGKTLAQFSVENKGPLPKITSSIAINNIQVNELLKDLANNSKAQLTGTGNITSHLQTQGKNTEAWINNLNGDLRFAINDGSLMYADIGKQIFSILQMVIKHGAPTQDETNQIKFSSLTGNVLIEHGIANNDDLLLKSSSLEVAGKGSADLHNQTIDYHLFLTALGQPFGQDALDFQKKIGGHIPLLITGNFANPKVKLNFQEVISTEVAEIKLKEQVQKVVGKDVGEAIQKLGNIFNN